MHKTHTLKMTKHALKQWSTKVLIDGKTHYRKHADSPQLALLFNTIPHQNSSKFEICKMILKCI